MRAQPDQNLSLFLFFSRTKEKRFPQVGNTGPCARHGIHPRLQSSKVAKAIANTHIQISFLRCVLPRSALGLCSSLCGVMEALDDAESDDAFTKSVGLAFSAPTENLQGVFQLVFDVCTQCRTLFGVGMNLLLYQRRTPMFSHSRFSSLTNGRSERSERRRGYVNGRSRDFWRVRRTGL